MDPQRPTDWAAMNGQLPPMFVPHHGGMAMRPQMVPQGGGQMLLPSEHMFVPPGVVLDASQFAAHAAARARHDYGAPMRPEQLGAELSHLVAALVVAEA